MRSLIAVPVLLALAACAVPSETTEHATTGQTKQRIVGGTPSTTAQDATVMLSENGTFSCTGTLIAPNLVLTARHCIAQLNENQGQCGAVVSDGQPSSQGISLGVNATAGGRVARGTKYYVPASKDLCGTDIALIQLDKDIPNAKIAKVRFTALAVGETTTAVGYGDNGNGSVTPGRYQRANVKIEAVGPGNGSYRTKQGQNLPYPLPNGDFSTSESTCFGDSGGPLFDAQGRLVGVTSRGIDDSCLDRPSIFTGVIFNKKLIEDAAKSAGHPLDEATPPPTTPDPGDSTSPSNDDPGGSRGGDDDADTGSESEDEETTDEKKTPKRLAPVYQTSGCSSSPTPINAPSGALVGLALAALVAFRARRKEA